MKKLIALSCLVAALVPATALAQKVVADVKIGKSVVDRQIGEETTQFALGERAFVWMRAEGAAGQKLTVTWKSGEQSFPVTLDVQGSPWRTWSSKILHLPGTWTVTIADAAGNPISESKITVQ